MAADRTLIHPTALPRVAVLGAGTMGRGIAALLAGSGREVAIHDPCAAALEAAAQHVARETAGTGRLSRHAALPEAVAAADLVIEAIPEDLELKRAVIAETLEAAPDDCIVASNTSSLRIDALAQGLAGATRVLGVHWFNPPELIPGVEVVPGAQTSAAVVEAVLALLHELGREPVVVDGVPGFVANRLQEAMVAEALRCLDQGVVSAADLDRVVRTTFGPRLAVCGPLEIVDQVGLEVERRALAHLDEASTGGVYAVPDVLGDLIRRGRTGIAAGAGFHDYDDDPAAVLGHRAERLAAVLAAARRHDGPRENDVAERTSADGLAAVTEHRAWIRLRFGPSDARYGDGLVDGSRLLQLFGDLATELSILIDGDEGLFRAYESVDFLAPVRAGDFIEAEAWVIGMGRTSRRLAFEARRRIAAADGHGPTAAEELAVPEVTTRAVGTVVVPAERQRLDASRRASDAVITTRSN